MEYLAATVIAAIVVGVGIRIFSTEPSDEEKLKGLEAQHRGLLSRTGTPETEKMLFEVETSIHQTKRRIARVRGTTPGASKGRAQPASPSQPPAPTPAPPQPTAAARPSTGFSREEQKRHWSTVRTRFREHQLRMASFETDPALAIEFPAFNDVSVPEVSAMVKALRQATALDDSSNKDSPIGGSAELLTRFEASVHDFGSAIDIAEAAARRLRWSHLGEADRTDLAQIKALLAHAESPGNTDEARRGYYARMQTVIRRLNDRAGHPVITTGALAAIEESARLALD